VLDRYLEQYRSDAPVPAADTPEDLDDLLFSSFGKDESTGTAAAENFPPPKPRATLFPVEEEFLSASFQYLAEQEIGVELPTRNAVEDLRELNEWCSRVLPYELRIKGQDLPRFRFTESVERMQRAVVESRAVASAGDDDEDAELQESWPDVSFLWPLHPVSAWVTAYVASLAGTHSAFVLATTALPPGSCCFLVVAQVPNAYGEALLQGWHGVPFAADGTPLPLRTLESLIAELRLATPDLANPGNIPESVLDRLSGFRKQAIERVGQEMQAARRTFIETEKARNSAREQALSARIRGTSRQMELRLNDIRDASIRRMKAARLEQEQRERERELNDFIHWTKTNRQPEDFVHAVIVAVFVNTAPDAQEARHV
jgi:hypothetical protein